MNRIEMAQYILKEYYHKASEADEVVNVMIHKASFVATIETIDGSCHTVSGLLAAKLKNAPLELKKKNDNEFRNTSDIESFVKVSKPIYDEMTTLWNDIDDLKKLVNQLMFSSVQPIDNLNRLMC